jgi:hypothetical protein
MSFIDIDKLKIENMPDWIRKEFSWLMNNLPVRYGLRVVNWGDNYISLEVYSERVFEYTKWYVTIKKNSGMSHDDFHQLAEDLKFRTEDQKKEFLKRYF